VISTFAYVYFQYWWLLSLLTMQPAAYVNYKLQIQGLFFIGLILGTIVGELICSGRQSDWLVVILAKKNGGVKTPEMRLWFGYPGAVLGSLGLLIWGLSIDRQWHWITGQIGFFLCESPTPVNICGIVNDLSSWCWTPNWQHSTISLHRRQLLRALHGHNHLLLRNSQREPLSCPHLFLSFNTPLIPPPSYPPSSNPGS
jgi:hypothetical protein